MPEGWIAWDGEVCPVPPETLVLVKMRLHDWSMFHEKMLPLPASEYRWDTSRKSGRDIAAYKVIG